MDFLESLYTSLHKTRLKKKTGITLDGFGNTIKKKTKAIEDNPNNLLKKDKPSSILKKK